MKRFRPDKLADRAHAGQPVGRIANPIVVIDPPRLLLPPSPPVDLCNVSAGQNHGDQLHESKDDADAGVHDHHRQDVTFELILQQSHASVHEDLVPDQFGAH